MIYIVKTGDTLFEIAKNHGITLKQLLDANPKFQLKPNIIQVGEQIVIPDVNPQAHVLGKLSVRRLAARVPVLFQQV